MEIERERKKLGVEKRPNSPKRVPKFPVRRDKSSEPEREEREDK